MTRVRVTEAAPLALVEGEPGAVLAGMLANGLAKFDAVLRVRRLTPGPVSIVIHIEADTTRQHLPSTRGEIE